MNTRRQVIRWIAAVTGTVMGLLPKLRRRVLAQETKPFEAGTLDELKENDNQLLIEEDFPGGPLLVVIEDPEDPETVRALNPTCTHRGCLVALEDGELVCPCHGARYDLDGKVTRGPAREDLTAYTLEIDEEGLILVSEA